jgi:hypothetical protein
VWSFVDAGRLASPVSSSVRSDPFLAGVSRVLGVRQLVQAFLVGRSGSAEAHTLGALVDAAHGASMLPFVFLRGRRGAFARTQLVVAVVLTCVEIALVGSDRTRGR